MRRSEWRDKSQDYIESATYLISVKRYSTGYHLIGIAVECAFKAVISKQFSRHTWPDMNWVKNIFIHDFSQLVTRADLNAERHAHEAATPGFAANWAIVKDWNIDSRYKKWSKSEAKDMMDAATNANNGVLPWLNTHW